MTRKRRHAKSRLREAPAREASAGLQRYWKRVERNHANLLTAIRKSLPELRSWASENIESMWGYEDGMYRFYHHSSKVIRLKGPVRAAVRLFRKIRPGGLNRDYDAIVRAGIAKDAKWADVVVAFLHTKYFVEMMIKYGEELVEAPHTLPSGWASVLHLYNVR